MFNFSTRSEQMNYNLLSLILGASSGVLLRSEVLCDQSNGNTASTRCRAGTDMQLNENAACTAQIKSPGPFWYSKTTYSAVIVLRCLNLKYGMGIQKVAVQKATYSCSLMMFMTCSCVLYVYNILVTILANNYDICEKRK